MSGERERPVTLLHNCRQQFKKIKFCLNLLVGIPTNVEQRAIFLLSFVIELVIVLRKLLQVYLFKLVLA